MIRSFRHKGLKELFETGRSAGVATAMHKRCCARLDALDYAKVPRATNLPGFNFHRLQGGPVRYTIHLNGPWCITFGWQGMDAVGVDLEQYH
jgi:proteic killer suppression protein